MQISRQIKQIVGDNIKARRLEIGWSRPMLAQRAGLADPMHIYRWERGLHRPNDDNLVALAVAMDRDIAWFYTDHDAVAA